MAMKLLTLPEQTPSDEIDEEILEIFVEEVQEVLEEIKNNFITWRDNTDNVTALQDLRRAFHTLKGSGRLVGAMVIGELGWRFENMLNRVIDGVVEPNDLLFGLLAQIETVLPGMIDQFQNGLATPHSVILLISQADYLTETKGESIGEFAGEGEEGTVVETATPQKPIEKSAEKPLIDIPSIDTLEADTESVIQEVAEIEETAFIEEMPDFDEDMLGLDLSETEEIDLDILPESELENIDENLELEELPILDTFEEEVDLGAVEKEFLIEEATLNSGSRFIEDEDADGIDPILLDIFKRESSQHIVTLKNFFEHYSKDTVVYLNQDVIRAFHTLNGSSRSVHFPIIYALAGPMENYTRLLTEEKIALTPDIVSLFNEAIYFIERSLDGDIVDEEQQATLLHKIDTSREHIVQQLEDTEKVIPAAPPSKAEPKEEASIPDANDEFMLIFLEEAEEILENTQSLIERWQSAPKNMQLMKELQRELHTLKGGARMVGIKEMGDLSHHLESVLTRIVEGNAQFDLKLQDIVQNSADELAAMLEAVRSGVPLEMPGDLIDQINATLVVEGEEETTTLVTTTTQEKKEETKPTVAEKEETIAEEKEKVSDKEDSGESAAEDRIRVRVSLIDNLTKLAGELSINRAHMEQQQGSMKNNLGEMEQTVIRLRDQLRRLEIETEAQILSSFSEIQLEEDDEEFDPLELDRFSLMQQLSRSLMETINDLMNIQDALKILTRQTDGLLLQQTRIGGDLQDSILRTRMVPFSRISPRLQRIARLTSRELRKKVEFIINGEDIEFERTVLNRVVAPLEHMLRNAIGHGIEEEAIRKQAGKSEIAKIMIDLDKEGSDLIINLSDDGAGLNLAAIRKKAEERGLLTHDQVIADEKLMQFILEPAFSTAKAVTQVAGRGVGMDVANSEIKQLGGTLHIHSKPNRGTTFEIRLPLSLTINYALMIHLAEETMAIPLQYVEAVLRSPRQDVLTNSEDDVRYCKYMDKDYRVFHLGDLLGVGRQASVDSPLIPTLLVRSGEKRIALLVDGIEGSKEIVVKPVGPQISAIQWLAGATILGDGRVVLILDVPTLTRTEKAVTYDVPVIEEKEEKLTPTTVMVVDDSITVRKVTARLLKRQGMEVLTAKDGVDAVAQLQESIPDLMLLDVEMPRMDGYELATQVRNTPNLRHIPIIMITSRTGAKHRDRAEKIGINRYLGKPFNETELLENINSLLEEDQAQQEDRV